MQSTLVTGKKQGLFSYLSSRCKTLLASKVGIYVFLLFFMSTSLGSHSFAYWPGDNWWLRSTYWLIYLLVAAGAIYGIHFLLKKIKPTQNEHNRFALAVLISFPLFLVMVSALDLASGRGTSRFFLNLHQQGLINSISINFISQFILKHISLGGLLYVLHFYLSPHASKSNEKADNKQTSAIGEKPVDFKLIPFLTKLPKNEISQPLLLQAQEHYLDVLTKSNKHLILYKFSQAIRELPRDLGLQTHRSFWVSHSNVIGWYKNGSGLRLQLSIGDSVPVSRRFEQQVKKHHSEIKQTTPANIPNNNKG